MARVNKALQDLHLYAPCIWLLSFCMFLRFLHGVAWVCILFFFIPAAIPLYGNAALCLFCHKWMSIGAVSSLGIMDNAAVNVCPSLRVSTCLPLSLGHVPGSGVAGSYGKLLLKFYRNDCAVFRGSGFSARSSQPQQQCLRVPSAPTRYCPGGWGTATHLRLCGSVSCGVVRVSLTSRDVDHALTGHACIFFAELSMKTFRPLFPSGCLPKF